MSTTAQPQSDRYPLCLLRFHDEYPAETLAALHLALVGMAVAGFLGEAPEAALRAEWLERHECDPEAIPAEAILDVAASLAFAWRTLRQEANPPAPRALLLVFAVLTSGLVYLGGRHEDAEAWTAVTAELSVGLRIEEKLYAARQLIEGLDHMWWEVCAEVEEVLA